MKDEVEVAVYRFRGSQDCDEFLPTEPAPFGVVSFHLDLVATVVVAAAGLSPDEVAARAWIEAVGRYRHEYLVSLNAPQAVLDSQISPLKVVAELYEPPEEMKCGGCAFIYGTCAESWLMLIESEWYPDAWGPDPTSAFSRAAPRSRCGKPSAEDSGVLRSLWRPSVN